MTESTKHSRLLIFFFNYRTLFGYIMTMSYICMHYYVSNKQQQQLIQTNQITIDSLNSNNINTNIVKKPRRLLLQNYDYFLVSKSKRNIRNMNIYSTSDKSVILNTLKRNQRLIVDKSLNGKRKLTINNDDLKFDYINHHEQNYYNLKNKTIKFSSQILQDQILIQLLNTTYLNNLNASSNGVFVEAGAYDGETWSNTLYLERFKNWTGLLIEPSTENYMKLKNKHRNAYSINNCLSKSSIKSEFIEAGPFGITTNVSALRSSNNNNNNDIHIVICHPLEKILNNFFDQFSQFKYKKSRINASEKPTIDYMSLDIEGNEKTIIETFPWNNFQINFLSIEYNQNKQVYEWLKSYLRKFGYLETIIDDVWYQDVYLAHESVYNQLNLKTKYVSEF